MSGIVFVNMPFAPPDRPSIAIGILQALLASAGLGSKAYYFNIDFYEKIEIDLVRKITGGESRPQDLLGEWVFSDCSRPGDGVSPHHISSIRCAQADQQTAFLEAVQYAKKCAPEFLNQCTNEIIRQQPDLVCFTTVFQQNMASLALAQSIKRRQPSIKILFGGANCHGVSGRALLSSYEFIDAVCISEGEDDFLNVVDALLNDRHMISQNYIFRSGREIGQIAEASSTGRPFVDLNNVPVPIYDDFFDRWKTFTKAAEFDEPSILFETSRGCWWGQKAHCTFCGLNGTGMAFRHKSADRALDEIEKSYYAVWRRYAQFVRR